MGEWILYGVAAAWLAWSAVNVAVTFWSQRHAGRLGYGAYVVGLVRPRIVVTRELDDQLTLEEYLGIWFHEFGHVRRQHVQRNFAIAVLLPFYRSSARVVRQELEADAYAAQAGFAAGLASALRKVSSHPFDLKRAELLEQSTRRDAGDPTRGMREQAIREG